MLHNRYRLLAGLLAILLSLMMLGPVVAQDPTATPGGLEPTLDATLQDLMEEAVAAGDPGLVLWLDAPDGTFAGAAGYADVEAEIPLQPDDTFRIGSITKTFTAVVVLRLAEEGRLALDDSLSDWLPELAATIPHAEDVTLRHLLNHTSGIYNYTDGPSLLEWAEDEEALAQPIEPAALVALIAGEEPYFEPGESWQYSNTNYILLGLVIEAAAQTTLAEAYQTYIIEPLGLSSTYLPDSEIEHPASEALVQGYSQMIGTRPYHTSMAWSAGALVSNAPDLIAFLRAVLSGEVFADPASLDMMRDTVHIGGRGGYGLGLITDQSPVGPIWGHNGSIFGFASQAYYFEDHDMVLVYLTNTDAPQGVPTPDFYAALEAYLAGEE